MKNNLPGLLLVGNFLSHLGKNRGVCEDLEENLTIAGWNVIVTSRFSNRFLRLLDMMQITWKKRHVYQVAHIDVFSGPAFLWAEKVVWILRQTNKPVILTLHGGNLPEFANKNPRRVKRVLEQAVIVTAPSGFLVDQMKKYRTDIIQIPNPIQLDRYQYHPCKEPLPYLIWVRAFHSIYNPVIAPQIIHSLKKDFPSVHLAMVGPDKKDGSFEATQSLAKRLDVESCIEFVGGVSKEEVPSWLLKGHIFLNTTNFDNTPVTVLEAMACGLCIVSTNVGGIPYLLEHEKDALLVPPDDPEAMAEAIKRILNEPELARKLSSNARKKAERCDWSVVLPQWETLFKSNAQSN